MWMLDNRTKYGADRTWLRDKSGAHVWLVVVKATFDLGDDGQLMLADEQPPPLAAPEYSGKPGLSSLLYEADLLPPKATTDILMHGVVYAPHGAAARALGASLKVDTVHKRLVVHGPRMHVKTSQGIALSAAEPFAEFPLSYEWAYGGIDASDPDPARHAQYARNPIGKGFAENAQALVNTPAWRIEYLNQDPAQAGPGGFGPLASHWSPRVELAGTYDEAWQKLRKPLLPADYQENFVQCAPLDQRPEKYLRGGEPVEVLGLTRGGLLRFALPRIYLVFRTFIRRDSVEHRARLATVLIEPELKRLQLVWQTTLAVAPNDVEYLDKTRIREKAYAW
jgi:hypothetical protein